MARIGKITPSEDDEQIAFVDWLKANQIPHASITNSQNISGANRIAAIKMMQKLKRLGLAPGFPDLLVILGHKILFIEMKRTGKSTTQDNQKEWVQFLDLLPYAEARICNGCDEAIDFVNEINMET
ncbi:MAG: VRR-NUC domain-containing protein [Proteobacteria bacterium]|nr:VRR-NUC domain-containing protein [Pseudomonadota bacterium]